MFPRTLRLKLLEIQAGVDGFMVYDLRLIEPMQKVSGGVVSGRGLVAAVGGHTRPDPSVPLRQLFQQHTGGENQLHRVREDVTVTPEDLLCMPAVGGRTPGLGGNPNRGLDTD